MEEDKRGLGSRKEGFHKSEGWDWSKGDQSWIQNNGGSKNGALQRIQEGSLQ